jgi:hypothetical protein
VSDHVMTRYSLVYMKSKSLRRPVLVHF